MSRLLTVLALVILTLAVQAEPGRPEVGPLVQGSNTFALDLFGRLRQQEGNFVFSPYAVSSSLAMTSFGAKGRTQDELNRTVHLLDQERLHPAYQALNETFARGDSPSAGLRMIVRNDLRGYQGTMFDPAFLQLARQSYGGRKDSGDQVDTNPIRLVKQDADKDAAPEAAAIRPANDDTLPLTLVASVRFEVNKEAILPTTATPGGTFTLVDGRPVQVPFLVEKGLFASVDDKDVQVVELPYAHSDLRLVLLLPRDPANMAQFEKSLNLEKLARLVNRMLPHEVEVRLPRCRVTSDGSLKKPLTQLGLGNLFGSGADLSGLSDASKTIYLGDVVHHAAIDIGSCRNEALPPRPSAEGERAETMVFQADHPFLFMVRDAGTGAILLMGRVADPTK